MILEKLSIVKNRLLVIQLILLFLLIGCVTAQDGIENIYYYIKDIKTQQIIKLNDDIALVYELFGSPIEVITLIDGETNSIEYIYNSFSIFLFSHYNGILSITLYDDSFETYKGLKINDDIAEIYSNFDEEKYEINIFPEENIIMIELPYLIDSIYTQSIMYLYNDENKIIEIIIGATIYD